jgi:hypothetical protein
MTDAISLTSDNTETYGSADRTEFDDWLR